MASERHDEAEPHGETPVWIDDSGLLHRGRSWIALSDLEWRLMRLLLQKVGQVVRREDLAATGWPDLHVDESRLNGRIRLIRARVEPLGLVITTVRTRGYVLTVDGE